MSRPGCLLSGINPKQALLKRTAVYDPLQKLDWGGGSRIG